MVGFNPNIGTICNSPNMVTYQRVDKVICDLEAHSTNVIRNCHEVRGISPPAGAVIQRGADFACVIVEGDLIAD